VRPEWDVPEGRFEVDKHTISLWHFDEAPGINFFKDASGNEYNLWRSGVWAVEAQGNWQPHGGNLKNKIPKATSTNSDIWLFNLKENSLQPRVP
jgi:hypothetical protein